MEEQLHLLTGAYSLNAVDDSERTEFERFAMADVDAQDEVRTLSETAALLAYAIPEETPPAELKTSVMAAIRNTRQVPASSIVRDISSGRSHQSGLTQARSNRRWAIPAAAAAALLVLGGIGAGGWALGHDSGKNALETQLAQARSTQDQQNEFLAIMAAPDAKVASKTLTDGGSVTVVSSEKANHAAVMTTALPTLPADKTYQLWYISATGAVPAGLMQATSDPSLHVLQGASGAATNVGITVEPSGGSLAPTTTPILVQSL